MAPLPNVRDLGIIALMLNLGAQPDEIDPAMVKWMDEFPEPRSYEEVVAQAKAALGMAQREMGRLVDAQDDELILRVPLVNPDAPVAPRCEVCDQLIVVRTDHDGRVHQEMGIPVPA